MGRLRPLLRLSAVFLLFLVVVGLDACDDDREPIVGPNARMLDGDDIYAITLISAGILRFQNVVADTALRFLALTSDTTVTFVGDTPTGTMTMQLTGDGIGGGPDTAIVMFTNFRDTTSVSVADFIDGALQYVFTQTENGLEYEMNPSDVNLVPLGLAQFAVQYTLTNELENMVLLAAGAIHSEMQAGAGSAQSGDVWQTGSFRIEDRDQRALVLLELDISYEYDENALPAFEDWPGGSLEFGGFIGGATLQPFDVMFDGLGGAVFYYLDTLCDTDLTDPENGNPCENLRPQG
jgi:hypothetical protein